MFQSIGADNMHGAQHHPKLAGREALSGKPLQVMHR